MSLKTTNYYNRTQQALYGLAHTSVHPVSTACDVASLILRVFGDNPAILDQIGRHIDIYMSEAYSAYARLEVVEDTQPKQDS